MKLPNKTGTVYKLGGKRRKPWIARAYAGKDAAGIRKYKTIGYYPTKTEALQALMEYNANPYDVDTKKLTLQEVFILCRNEKAKDIKPQSVRDNYDLIFERFFSPLKDEVFTDLRPMNYQKVLDVYGANKNKEYMQKGKRLLSAIYKYAMLNDIIGTDYSQGVVARGKPKEAQGYFTEKELTVLIQNMDKVTELGAVVTMCLTGLRPSELLNCSTDTVDLEHRLIRHVGVKTAAGKYKRVPISDIIYSYLKKKCEATDNFLFNTEGQRMTYNHFLEYVYKPALFAVNIPYKSPKACRHTFANITLGLLNDKTRKSIIGHTDISLTNDVYTDLEDHKLWKEFNKVEAYIVESLTKV